MTVTRQKQVQKIIVLMLVLSLPGSVFAVELNEAARRAARSNDAKVLSAKTIKQGNRRTHQIKLLTKKGVVKTVNVPANGKKKK